MNAKRTVRGLTVPGNLYSDAAGLSNATILVVIADRRITLPDAACSAEHAVTVVDLLHPPREVLAKHVGSDTFVDWTLLWGHLHG